MKMRGFLDSGKLRLDVSVALVARKQLEDKPIREPDDCPHFCARNMQSLRQLSIFRGRRFPQSKKADRAFAVGQKVADPCWFKLMRKSAVLEKIAPRKIEKVQLKHSYQRRPRTQSRSARKTVYPHISRALVCMTMSQPKTTAEAPKQQWERRRSAA
jgi:hypothetical protein